LFETLRLLPESVVWLCANNRVAEAEQIIRNAAKLNNITMPDMILAQPDTAIGLTEDNDTDGKKSNDDIRTSGRKLMNNIQNQDFMRSEKTEDRRTRYTVLDILRNRHLTINMFCLSFMWSVK